MTRKPRGKNNRLVSIRMMTHAYLLMGAIGSAAGFYTYFIVMEVYGFSPSILINIMKKEGVVPLNSDLEPDLNFNRVIPFNKDAADFGNPFLPPNC